MQHRWFIVRGIAADRNSPAKSRELLSQRMKYPFVKAVMNNKNRILLLCAALVFFLPFFIAISRMPDPVLDNLVPFIITGLSFCSAALFVIRIKPVFEHWYRGLFHVAMTGMVFLIIISRFFSLSHTTDYLILSLAFLSLISIGFFMMFPGDREDIRSCILVSCVIGLYGVFLAILIIMGFMNPGQTSWNVTDGLSAIYLLLLMPIMGICHILVALKEMSAPDQGAPSA